MYFFSVFKLIFFLVCFFVIWRVFRCIFIICFVRVYKEYIKRINNNIIIFFLFFRICKGN